MDIDVLGHRIHYERVGRGPPLYFVHGGPGLDHTYFRPFLDPLADDAELVFYDQLGNGRSERPEPLAVDLTAWATELDGLRAALGHDSIVTFGHSFGALVATLHALLFPDSVRGLILCAPGNLFEFPAQRVEGSTVRRHDDDDAFRRHFLARLPRFFHRFDADLAAALDGAIHYSARASAHGMASLETFRSPLPPGALRVPTSILVGRHDRLTPLEAGPRRLSNALPSAELVTFHESGHFPFIEERERSLDVVRGFLRRLGKS